MGRLIVWVVIAGALALSAGFLALDVMAYAAGNAWHPVPLGQRWFEWHRESLLLLQPAIERYLSPGLWSGVQWLLERPAWLAPAAVAALLLAAKGVRRLSRRSS